jgi:hypothetical protein
MHLIAHGIEKCTVIPAAQLRAWKKKMRVSACDQLSIEFVI